MSRSLSVLRSCGLAVLRSCGLPGPTGGDKTVKPLFRYAVAPLRLYAFLIRLRAPPALNHSICDWLNV